MEEEAAVANWDPDLRQAYVLEFRMTGLAENSAETARMVAQLAWGAGIALEYRGAGEERRVSVRVRGPGRQVVRAETELEECHVGEEGALVRVRVSAAEGVVRAQFAPGQIDPRLV